MGIISDKIWKQRIRLFSKIKDTIRLLYILFLIIIIIIIMKLWSLLALLRKKINTITRYTNLECKIYFVFFIVLIINRDYHLKLLRKKYTVQTFKNIRKKKKIVQHCGSRTRDPMNINQKHLPLDHLFFNIHHQI